MRSTEIIDRDARLQALFPYLAERTYLDTAAVGLCWQGFGSAVGRFYDEVLSRGYDVRPQWLEKTGKVRARLASWLRVGPQDITFVSNTTDGLNLAANSLQFQAGDRIVCAQDEFPSALGIWKAAMRQGAELVLVPVPNEEERQARLLEAARAGTKVLVVSHTHPNTGTTLDLAALGRHCREHGILLMVDGIQALGAVPTCLEDVDIYSAAFFKWMLSGFGFGMLVTSERARDLMKPIWQGYANMDDERQLQYAHVNSPALYGLDATLDLFESIGWDTVHGRVRTLGDQLIAEADRLGLNLVTPRHQRAGIHIFRVPDGEAVRLRLAEQGISISARGEGVRIAPHFYNSTQDVQQCAAALAQVLADT